MSKRTTEQMLKQIDSSDLDTETYDVRIVDQGDEEATD